MKAKLVFLTGSKSGTSVPLADSPNTLGRGRDQSIGFSPDEVLVSSHHATIFLQDGRFHIRDDDSRNGTFINQQRITQYELEPGDVIEFGPGGPSAQFVAEGEEEQMQQTLDVAHGNAPLELLRAARARALERSSDHGRVTQSFSTTREFMVMAYQRSSRRARRTAIALVTFTVLGLGVVIAWQQQSKAELQAALADVAIALDSERGSRAELAQNLANVQTRYDSLMDAVTESRRQVERNERFGAKVTRSFSRGVALIVFSYGFSQRGGTDLLRFQVDTQGRAQMLTGKDGRQYPRIGFGGDGPALERHGSATGFLVDSAGWIITNEHVAQPWEHEQDLDFFKSRGLDVEPRFIVLHAFFPPGDRSYPLIVHGASADADVAVMRTLSRGVDAPILPLAGRSARVAPGEQLVFIGYPTGVHNLLFRVSHNDRADILAKVADDNPIDLARELATRQLIQPLVISGSVSDTTGTEVIHTAAATGGGSGGPLISANESVVAIHYAAVRSPTPGDPFQTQRAVHVSFVWDILPADVRQMLAGR